MVASRDLTAADLTALAGLYAEDGHLDSAIPGYQAALAKDPDYFPARIAIAQALTTAHRYDESIELLSRLNDEFPDDAKIILSLARVLSWSRRYDDAIRTYRDLSALNPADTVPRTEMARVANTFWHEKGIGRASDIERQHFQSGAEVVWNSQTQIQVSGDYCLELPSFTQNREVQLQSNCSPKGLQFRYARERRIRGALVRRVFQIFKRANVLLNSSANVGHQISLAPDSFSARRRPCRVK